MDTIAQTILLHNIYRFECYDSTGTLKWVEEIPNTTVNQGLNDLLTQYFKGAAYTAAFFVGLKGSGSISAGDTLASHSGWTEVTAYTGNRQALVLGSVSGQSVDNSASKAVFTMNGSYTVAGAFVATVASGTSGVLYGAADFGTPRSGASGDVLNVTVTLTAASA